jgi:hypothetical protein
MNETPAKTMVEALDLGSLIAMGQDDRILGDGQGSDLR